jgi:hypothetical protein
MQLLTLPDVAEALGIQITRAHQLVRDGQLVAIRDTDGVRRVPAGFVQDGMVVKGLSGVITVLRDARYTDEEIVDWLFREDDSLPGAPITALRENRGTEVKRRAQAAGY